MKIRVWGGHETLATIHGKELQSFEAMEKWLRTQPDGQIEVWAGKWLAVSREARPFTVTSGAVFCAYGPYQSKKGLDPADHSGFFAFEAWKRAKMLHDFWGGIDKMAGEASDAAREE